MRARPRGIRQGSSCSELSSGMLPPPTDENHEHAEIPSRPAVRPKTTPMPGRRAGSPAKAGPRKKARLSTRSRRRSPLSARSVFVARAGVSAACAERYGALTIVAAIARPYTTRGRLSARRRGGAIRPSGRRSSEQDVLAAVADRRARPRTAKQSPPERAEEEQEPDRFCPPGRTRRRRRRRGSPTVRRRGGPRPFEPAEIRVAEDRRKRPSRFADVGSEPLHAPSISSGLAKLKCMREDFRLNPGLIGCTAVKPAERSSKWAQKDRRTRGSRGSRGCRGREER